MTKTILPQSRMKNWRKVRDAWVAEVEKMADDLERWSADNDWDTKREMKELEEEGLGRYRVPVVRVQTMQGRLYFEPVARFILGAAGRIELTATPSFWQVILLKERGRWQFFDENLKNLRKAWAIDDFQKIAVDLMKKR
jgi:hypothetical protein